MNRIGEPMLRRTITRERARELASASVRAALGGVLIARAPCRTSTYQRPPPAAMNSTPSSSRGEIALACAADRLDDQRQADRHHQQREHERAHAVRLSAVHLI